MNMYLNTFIIALNIIVMIIFGVSFGYWLVSNIKDQDTETFIKRFFRLIGISLAGVLLYTLIIAGILECGTDVILELISKKVIIK